MLGLFLLSFSYYLADFLCLYANLWLSLILIFILLQHAYSSVSSLKFSFSLSRVYFNSLSHTCTISPLPAPLRLRHSYIHCLSHVHFQTVATGRGINNAARTQVAQVFTLLEHDTSRLSFSHSDMRLCGAHCYHSRGSRWVIKVEDDPRGKRAINCKKIIWIKFICVILSYGSN